jgi:hypothetical protein
MQTYMAVLDFLVHVSQLARNEATVKIAIVPPRLRTVADCAWKATFFSEVVSFFLTDKLTSQHDNANCTYCTNDTVLPISHLMTETILPKSSDLESGIRRSIL